MDPKPNPPNAAPEELAPELEVRPPEPPPPPTPEALLDAQYAGAKEALRPLYDALAYLARRVGPQSKAVPSATFVRFERKGIPFGVVRAATKTRLDLGLALPEQTPRPPWRVGRRFCGVERITHRLELFDPGDIDGLLVQWMRLAYELARPEKQPTKKAEAPPEQRPEPKAKASSKPEKKPLRKRPAPRR